LHPILLDLGFFSIKTYGFLIATGFLLGILVAKNEAKRLQMDPQVILDLAFYIIVGAIVGSRLFFVATRFSYYQQHPLDIFKVWEGGLVFYGGFIMAAAICVWMIKKNRLKVGRTLDIFAPSLSLGVFFGRLGCFCAGCCYGKPCDLPWAVTFTDPHCLAVLNTPLHPTQLYSSLGGLITFIVLYSFRKRKSYDGQLTLIWILMYSGFRSVIEFFRGDMRGTFASGDISVTHILAVVLALSALVALIVMKVKKAGKGGGDSRSPR